MNGLNLKAVLTEEEEDLRREDSLAGIRRLLDSQPERFRLKAEPAAFPPRKRTCPIPSSATGGGWRRI